MASSLEGHNALQVTNPCLGLAEVISQTQLQRTYTVCVGDHSCECSHFMVQSGGVCKHLEATALVCPFTVDMRRDTARHLNGSGSLRSIQSSHGRMYEISAIASEHVTFVCNVDSSFCSCPDWNAGHGRTCCHLLAAAELTEGRRSAESVLQHAADTGEEEPLVVRRSFPQNTPAASAMVSPDLSQKLQAELVSLRQYETKTAALQSKAPLSEAHKAALGLCRSMASKLHTLDSASLDEVLPMLQQASAIVDALAPKLLPTLRVAQKGDARKDSDHIHKPLFKGRKRPAAAIASAQQVLKKGRTAAALLPGNGDAGRASKTAAAERIISRARASRRSSLSPTGAALPKFVANKPQGRPHTAVRLCHQLLLSGILKLLLDRALGGRGHNCTKCWH